jgi:3'5'-cyclic nucleotide phosphodiesterase
MSVSKLLSRIVAPSDVLDYMNGTQPQIAASLHDYTFGITSDPLTQFAVVFSALIHDCDHSGVPNAQLVNENEPLANRYHSKSVAEQNSIDLAWSLLTEDDYKELRVAICGTAVELQRFRQLVVNSILATDLADKGMLL